MASEIKNLFFVLFHPIKGFYGLKHERKGKFSTALIGVLTYAVTLVLNQQLTGFLFNPFKLQNPKLLDSLVQIFAIFIIFCVGNWSVTTLLGGEGKFFDIICVFGYASYTIMLIQVPVALISNLCSFTMGGYLDILNGLSMVWFFFLLFFGIMTVHQYSLVKMVATTVLTGIAMIIIVFIYLLLFQLISNIVLFIISLYKEISFRLL